MVPPQHNPAQYAVDGALIEIIASYDPDVFVGSAIPKVMFVPGLV